MNKNPFYLLLGVLLFFLYSCRYDKYEMPTPDQKNVSTCNVLQQDSVYFKKNVLPILSKNCGVSGCHAGPNPEGNFNLEAVKAYTSLLQKGSGYVDTVNPNNSVVISSLNSVSNPMPPTGRLDDCSIKLIYKWMQQKAKNN